MLNYDWLLSGEAVDAVGAGRSGDASLGYSSRGWVTGWFQAGFQLCLRGLIFLGSLQGSSGGGRFFLP